MHITPKAVPDRLRLQFGPWPNVHTVAIKWGLNKTRFTGRIVFDLFLIALSYLHVHLDVNFYKVTRSIFQITFFKESAKIRGT